MTRPYSILFILLLVSCSSQQIIPTPLEPTSLPSTMAEAHEVLINFFALLNARKYAEADALYSGNYEQLQIFNPDVDASDHTALWARACELSGLHCLQVRTATFKLFQGDTYIFQVEFNNTDGSLFVLGPCCGANETEMPPVSQFDYRVSRTVPGNFSVMDLPAYVP